MKLVAFLSLALPLLSAVSAKGVSLRTSRTKGEARRGLLESKSKDGSTGPGGIGICPTVGSSKGGKGGKGKGGGGGGDPCDICYNGRPDTLTLRYELPSANSLFQPENKATCRDDPTYPFPTTLSVAGGAAFSITNGTEFTLGGSFGASTRMDITGWGSCTIHTSCSVPLVPGDKIGPFLVVGDEDCIDPPEEECCIICDSDNKNRPPALTLQYKSAGKNSLYQSENKASCREGTYPMTTTITVETKTGSEQTFQVSDGDTFVVQGDFDANTDFTISRWGECNIHTSCSAPLIQFDQIGPFVVLEGNDCNIPENIEQPCISATKTLYECDENITVNFDYAFAESEEGMKGPLVDDWIGIYPCGNIEYKHSEAWLYACPAFGSLPRTCTEPASSGSVTFQNPMPAYNAFGPHMYPIAPFNTNGAGSTVIDCFQAVLLRFDGPSVPPYEVSCLSEPFTILSNSFPGCQVRVGGSPAYSPPP